MNNAKDNLQQCHNTAVESELYDRWAAFFCPLIGKQGVAEALCELGMKIVRREAQAGAAIRKKILTLLKEHDPNNAGHAP